MSAYLKLHLKQGTIHTLHVQNHGVGVRAAQIGIVEAVFKSNFLRIVKAFTQAFVVHRHAKQTANQRLVGSVAAVCFLKRAIQTDFG